MGSVHKFVVPVIDSHLEKRNNLIPWSCLGGLEILLLLWNHIHKILPLDSTLSEINRKIVTGKKVNNNKLTISLTRHQGKMLVLQKFLYQAETTYNRSTKKIEQNMYP
jgi:hypothetical protein